MLQFADVVMALGICADAMHTFRAQWQLYVQPILHNISLKSAHRKYLWFSYASQNKHRLCT
jgi:hypothetical protein